MLPYDKIHSQGKRKEVTKITSFSTETTTFPSQKAPSLAPQATWKSKFYARLAKCHLILPQRFRWGQQGRPQGKLCDERQLIYYIHYWKSAPKSHLLRQTRPHYISSRQVERAAQNGRGRSGSGGDRGSFALQGALIGRLMQS